ncbi:MAG: cytochrome c oxidase assembly protein [Hyphomicrobium sp.]
MLRGTDSARREAIPLNRGAAKNTRVGAIMGLVAVGMLGMAYAAVPLYQLFCQATGYGGTTQRVARPADKILDRTITVRFDANVNGLPWSFEPVVRTVDVRIGETTLAFYRATNNSDRAVVGTSSFNVAPDIAGSFFNKLECFCFKEQRLEPGEMIEMPVSFYVDPSLVDDKDARKVTQITLSYTFYPVDKPKQAADAARGIGGPGG